MPATAFFVPVKEGRGSFVVVSRYQVITWPDAWPKLWKKVQWWEEHDGEQERKRRRDREMKKDTRPGSYPVLFLQLPKSVHHRYVNDGSEQPWKDLFWHVYDLPRACPGPSKQEYKNIHCTRVGYINLSLSLSAPLPLSYIFCSTFHRYSNHVLDRTRASLQILDTYTPTYFLRSLFEILPIVNGRCDNETSSHRSKTSYHIKWSALRYAAWMELLILFHNVTLFMCFPTNDRAVPPADESLVSLTFTRWFEMHPKWSNIVTFIVTFWENYVFRASVASFEDAGARRVFQNCWR